MSSVDAEFEYELYLLCIFVPQPDSVPPITAIRYDFWTNKLKIWAAADRGGGWVGNKNPNGAVAAPETLPGPQTINSPSDAIL